MSNAINSEVSIFEKLNRLNLPEEEKDLIVENGARYRILEFEHKLKKIESEIAKLEKSFGQKFEDLETVGLPDEADYKTHENYMDLKALVYGRLEIQEKIKALKELFELE